MKTSTITIRLLEHALARVVRDWSGGQLRDDGSLLCVERVGARAPGSTRHTALV